VHYLRQWRPTRPSLRVQRVRYLTQESNKSTESSTTSFHRIDEDSPVDGTGSTITIRERNIFRKLFRNLERSWDDAHTAPVTKPQPHHVATQLPEELQDIALQFADRVQYKQYMTALRAGVSGLGENAGEAPNVQADSIQRLQKLRIPTQQKIVGLINAAKNEWELWKVLQDELFSKLKQARQAVSKKQLKKLKGKQPDHRKKDNTNPPFFTELEVMAPLYPGLLVAAIQKYCFDFKGSQFPFSILSELKNLGPHAYALGTSTSLFNALLAATWDAYGEFNRISSLLHEMESAGVLFDWDTWAILRDMCREAQKARGSPNDVLRAIAHMDFFTEGFEKVRGWRDLMHEQLQEEELRQANDQLTSFKIPA
jgi:Mtf2 family